jgi:outer membrane murein-binding lipoprotein Lpp
VELPEWSTLIPGAGFFGLLVFLVLHLMRQASGDRGDYQQTLRGLREQHADEMREERLGHAAEIRELTARHDGQIQDLRSQIGVLRAEVIDLREDVEAERKARWAAEDAAARYRRMIDGGGDAVEGGTNDPT